MSSPEAISERMLEYPDWKHEHWRVQVQTPIMDVPHYWENPCKNPFHLPTWWDAHAKGRQGSFLATIENCVIDEFVDFSITIKIEHDSAKMFAITITVDGVENSDVRYIFLEGECIYTVEYDDKTMSTIWHGEKVAEGSVRAPPPRKDLVHIKHPPGPDEYIYKDGSRFYGAVQEDQFLAYHVEISFADIERLLLKAQ